MELRLAYRALRQLSNWVLDHFYSEVLVDSSQLDGVDMNCPIILVSSHHNEIIDIASLAATMPNQGFVSYWAKSSMFRNPLARFILDSAAAIPVERNPNRTEGASIGNGTTNHNNVGLFSHTCLALASGNAIGVFPEGTSYTQPRVMQIKEGAARAAVEYIRWAKNRKGGKMANKPLLILPVGILYTDKSQYRSKIFITYGKSIPVVQYQSQLELDGEQTKKVVKEITEQIEQRLTELTINAPDWETLHAARLGFEMKYGENSDLNLYFPRMKRLVDEFSTPSATRARLLHYYSLLHHTKLKHSQLLVLIGPNFREPSTSSAFLMLVRVFLVAFLHPQLALYLPAFLVFFPAFTTGLLGARILGNRKEEETHAQYKAIFGGFGLGLSFTTITWAVCRFIAKNTPEPMSPFKWLVLSGAIFYTSALMMTTWHDAFIDGNYRRWVVLWPFALSALLFISVSYREFTYVMNRFKCLRAAWKIFTGTLQGPPDGFDFEPYERLPPPPHNPFIPRQERKGEVPEAPSIPSFYLMQRLLAAGRDALKSLKTTSESL